MIITLQKTVLHIDFGGFYFTNEMVKWLVENKKWSYEDFGKNGYDYNYLKENPGTMNIRQNPHLVECVETLQKSRGEQSYMQQCRDYIWSLQVIEPKIEINIIDYHDGRERLEIFGYNAD